MVTILLEIIYFVINMVRCHGWTCTHIISIVGGGGGTPLYISAPPPPPPPVAGVPHNVTASQRYYHRHRGAMYNTQCSFIPWAPYPETGVQHGDPLGPLFFWLVLHKLVVTIASDEKASHLLYLKWYIME